jgi:hypothetical protein
LLAADARGGEFVSPRAGVDDGICSRSERAAAATTAGLGKALLIAPAIAWWSGS